MLKLPCGADKTEDVIHESPVKSTSHTSEGVASVFQSFAGKKQLQFQSPQTSM